MHRGAPGAQEVRGIRERLYRGAEGSEAASAGAVVRERPVVRLAVACASRLPASAVLFSRHSGLVGLILGSCLLPSGGRCLSG